MINELFKFPVCMVDGDNEDKKISEQMRLGLPNKDNQGYDMIFGEAEYPYYDFIGVEDRWLPSKESLTNAMNGEFDACVVRFVNVGQVLVPWSKEKFKQKLAKFAQEYEAKLPPHPLEKREIRILNISPEQYNNIVGDTKQQ